MPNRVNKLCKVLVQFCWGNCVYFSLFVLFNSQRFFEQLHILLSFFLVFLSSTISTFSSTKVVYVTNLFSPFLSKKFCLWKNSLEQICINLICEWLEKWNATSRTWMTIVEIQLTLEETPFQWVSLSVYNYCGLKKSPQPSLHTISRFWMFISSAKIDR